MSSTHTIRRLLLLGVAALILTSYFTGTEGCSAGGKEDATTSVGEQGKQDANDNKHVASFEAYISTITGKPIKDIHAEFEKRGLMDNLKKMLRGDATREDLEQLGLFDKKFIDDYVKLGDQIHDNIKAEDEGTKVAAKCDVSVISCSSGLFQCVLDSGCPLSSCLNVIGSCTVCVGSIWFGIPLGC